MQAEGNSHLYPWESWSIEWYSDTLIKIVQRLGPSYAARGISYAGHGISDDVVGSKYEHNQSVKSDNSCLRDMSVPWTIEGQSE